ncbi:hypothetical protein BU23DRAFT_63381 [Bimuria novae-zelandiae CBS 107.79]|uniref:Uncharacterized protein n=1 Tax=Bimuria novae-zelandiae CBS 107.79 TaxID=1447943 RepID=A0A6A5UHQ7_9PLEO|nr:hypothetical protein BU23DRAFT_63381 [Bimuria novae-zelandiae CBS 107.79]
MTKDVKTLIFYSHYSHLSFSCCRAVRMGVHCRAVCPADVHMQRSQFFQPNSTFTVACICLINRRQHLFLFAADMVPICGGTCRFCQRRTSSVRNSAPSLKSITQPIVTPLQYRYLPISGSRCSVRILRDGELIGA